MSHEQEHEGSKSPALLLFDIDGTLLTTAGAGMRAMNRAGQAIFGERFTFQGINAAGHLDTLMFHEAAKNFGLASPQDHQQRFRERYLTELQQELQACRDRVSAIPGVRATLERLHQRSRQQGDLRLGLVSGNYTQAVPIKLRAAGIDPAMFQVSGFADDGPDRSALVAVAIQRANHQKAQAPAIIIGDTPRDVACAKANGCLAVGVATGPYSQDELRACGADRVLADLSDPSPLLELAGLA